MKQIIEQLRVADPVFDALCHEIKAIAPLGLAFSGGVDSTFLLALCTHLLEPKDFVAITASAPYMPKWELAEARKFANKIGATHHVIEFSVPNAIKGNPSNRCYLCKTTLFTAIYQLAERSFIHTIIDGSNYDDLDDYRPGMQALKELGVISPMLICKVTKAMIREWSATLKLPTWDKPAYACLLTRLPHDEAFHNIELEMVELAETYLFSLGFKAVRVRKHGVIARIEVDEDQLEAILKQRIDILNKLKKIGFKHITLDLNGYQLSGLNQ